MGYIERAVRLPVTVTVIVLLLVIFGIIGLRNMEVQLTPNVDQPVVTVSTNWFGAQPEDLVRDVLEEQEDVLKVVSGLKEMTSSANEGSATVRLQFDVGVDKDAALNEVRDKLRQVPDYPDGVDEPIVESTDRFNRDYIAWILVRRTQEPPSGTPAPGFEHGDITKLGTFLEERVKPFLDRAEGVSEINILGSRERELQVQVNMSELAARGIGIDTLLQRLREENQDVSAGALAEGKRDVTIRVVGQYDDPKQIEETVIAYGMGGAPVYVRDVATVVPSFKRETGFVRALGQPVVAINAQREVGTNVIEVMDNLRAAIDSVNKDVLGPTNWGIELDQVYDQTVYIDQSVWNAVLNLMIGAVLAGVVLFIALRSISATAVVLVAIPVSVVGTFLGMYLTGRSLNVVSMAGLTFAVGMGIDNAIVVLENIFRHREMGKDRIKAAVDGTKEVAGAIVAGTLTNIAVFAPILAIQDEAGQLFRDIAVALIISFGLYLFVAPTVVPMLATVFLRKMPGGLKHDDAQAAPDADHSGFYGLIYGLTTGWGKRLGVAAVLIVVPTTLAWVLMPPRDYLPQGNQNLIFGIVLPPPGLNVDEMRSAANVVESQLSPWWDAAGKPDQLKPMQEHWLSMTREHVVPGMREGLEAQEQGMAAQGVPESDIAKATAPMRQMIDQMASSLAPSAIDNFFFVKFGPIGFMGAIAEDADNPKSLMTLMNSTVMGKIPGFFGFFQQQPIFRTGTSGNALEISIFGPNYDNVRSAAFAAQMALLEAFGSFPNPDPPNFSQGITEMRITPDKARAGQAGLSSQVIRTAGQIGGDGVIVGDYRDRSESIDLTVISSIPYDQRRPEEMQYMPLVGRNGDIVPLGNVASFERTLAPTQINRTNEQPSVKLSLQIPDGMPLGQAVSIAEDQVLDGLREKGAIPSDVNYKLEGSADKLDAFLNAFIPGVLFAILVTYLLLAALFENFIHPLTIMFSVPLAMAGGLIGLAVMHAFVPYVKLDVLTMLGFVILIGTIINNPILIVHQALNNIREGMDRRHAIAFSTKTRVRPIIMTVSTTLAGLAPLVLFGGSGSELYRGLGTVLLSGLLCSTVFTLILTPTLMSLVMDLFMKEQLPTPEPTEAAIAAEPSAA